MSCDRDICATNEYNGIGCDECGCNVPYNMTKDELISKLRQAKSKNAYILAEEVALMEEAARLLENSIEIDRVLKIIDGFVKSKYYPDGSVEDCIENVEGLMDEIEAMKEGGEQV